MLSVAPVAKKPKPKKTDTDPVSTGSIRIKPDLAYKLRIIVEAEKTSAAEFLDPQIRQYIETQFEVVTRRLTELAQKQKKADG